MKLLPYQTVPRITRSGTLDTLNRIFSPKTSENCTLKISFVLKQSFMMPKNPEGTFSNMPKDTIVKNISHLLSKKAGISKKSPIAEKSRWNFSQVLRKLSSVPMSPFRLGKRITQQKTSKKQKQFYIFSNYFDFLIFFEEKTSPMSRIVLKNLRSPLCSSNALFLLKIEGGLSRKL